MSVSSSEGTIENKTMTTACLLELLLNTGQETFDDLWEHIKTFGSSFASQEESDILDAMRTNGAMKSVFKTLIMDKIVPIVALQVSRFKIAPPTCFFGFLLLVAWPIHQGGLARCVDLFDGSPGAGSAALIARNLLLCFGFRYGQGRSL